jgi:predicted oxidoreductase
MNTYADHRMDPDFSRKPEHLRKFDTRHGPYYALKGLRAFFLTLGGVRINRDMQALDGNDNVIPGLYVTGQDMGGFMTVHMTFWRKVRPVVLRSVRDALQLEALPTNASSKQRCRT